MTKISKTMRFEEGLWELATEAAKQTHRSTTGYIESAVDQQIRRDIESGVIKLKNEKKLKK